MSTTLCSPKVHTSGLVTKHYSPFYSNAKDSLGSMNALALILITVAIAVSIDGSDDICQKFCRKKVSLRYSKPISATLSITQILKLLFF